ncbi:MAG TPA: ABC transporter substrate-binding protein, partial [Candidatus Limnocylindrales bacterium]|nr:ABC transporter substrate-binding protein [Candidatus Limnocylindrales bacterium]
MLRRMDETEQKRSLPENGGLRVRRRATWLVVAVLWLTAAGVLRAQDGDDADVGKQIYTKGESGSKTPVEAVLAGGTTRIPASLMPCASCHGADGQGRPEGGVTPSNITWDILSAPLTSSDPLARNRPAYDMKSLRRAIAEGVDPAGNELGTAMPRFSMSAQDLDSLVDYLKRLGHELDPGVTKTTIRIGTIVPASGPMAAAGQNFGALLRAYFADLNQQGGIYGRSVEFELLPVSGSNAEIVQQAEDFVRSKNIFALAGILAPGAERGVEDAMQNAGVPVITPFASRPDGEESSDKSKIFYVLSGVSQQARVLVRFARERLEARDSPISVVFTPENRELADFVVRECRDKSFASVVSLKYTASTAEGERIADSLFKDKINAVLFLGQGRELRELLVAARKLNWSPVVFQPGSFAGKDVFAIPAAFNERVFFSFPSLPTDMEAVGLNEYGELLRNHHLTPNQPALAIS